MMSELLYTSYANKDTEKQSKKETEILKMNFSHLHTQVDLLTPVDLLLSLVYLLVQIC